MKLKGRILVGEFYWHVHHDSLVELCSGYEGRVAYIKAGKPLEEQALRLRLFRPVRGSLPAALVQAWAAYNQAGAAHDQAWAALNQARDAHDQAWDAHVQAGAAYNQAGAAYNQARDALVQAGAAYNQARDAHDQARAAYNQARDALVQAWAAHMPAILALHAQECPNCPWDGETIFPGESCDD